MSATGVSQILNAQGDLPDDVLLGRIVLFTITDERVKRDDLLRDFLANGLNTDLIPPDLKAVDAFKKATSEAKNKYSLANGREAHILCRDVVSDTRLIKRQITREVKDTKQRQLSYDRVVECTYYRPAVRPDPNTGKVATVKGSERVQFTIDSTGLDAGELQEVKDIVDEMQARYTRYYHFLDGQKLRGVVRDYLKYLNAIELKGGVYFIHVSKSAELHRLATVVHGWGGGCMMHLIPLVDVKREREMVAAAFEREASDSLREIATEIQTLRDNRKSITPAAYAKMKERYDEVVSKADEHQTTLQISQDLTGAAAETALKALLELQEEMLK